MFSIIIPLYNKADTIRKSIESVKKQTYPGEKELIIVDDGSTDQFQPVLDEFSGESFLKVIHQPNAGVSAARNTGIANSHYPYLCFLDADDEWFPNHLSELEKMVHQFPAAGLYCTATRCTFSNGTYSDSSCFMRYDEKLMFCVEDYFQYQEEIENSALFFVNSICVPNFIFSNVGRFQVGVRIGEDQDMWLRIAAYYPIVFTHTVTTLYHQELSTATKETTMDIDWYFQKREAALLEDTTIPQEKRNHLFFFMERFRLRKSRHLLLAGRKKESFLVLNSIRLWKGMTKGKLITYGCFLLPNSLLKKVYQRKREMENGL